MTDKKIEELFKSGNIELAVILMVNNPIDNLYDLLDEWMPVKERIPSGWGKSLHTEWIYTLNQDWNVTVATTSFRNIIKFYLSYKNLVLLSQIDIGKFNSYTKKKYLIKLIKNYIEHEELG